MDVVAGEIQRSLPNELLIPIVQHILNDAVDVSYKPVPPQSHQYLKPAFNLSLINHCSLSVVRDHLQVQRKGEAKTNSRCLVHIERFQTKGREELYILDRLRSSLWIREKVLVKMDSMLRVFERVLGTEMEPAQTALGHQHALAELP